MKSVALSLVVLVLLVSTAASARTWHIRPDGSGDAPTIQAGIDSAEAGDEVVLDDGVFSGAGNCDLDYLGKAITVRSLSGNPGACIISGNAQCGGVFFRMAEGGNSVLEGVKIEHGEGREAGGAVHCGPGSSPTIRNCVFNMCAAGAGGGIYCCGASPDISDCVIEECSAFLGGGGMYCESGSNPVIANCDFIDNRTDQSGGALRSDESSSLTIQSSTFRDNAAWSNEVPFFEGVCGGIFSFGPATIVGCVIANNRTQFYTAALCCGSGSVISDCVFAGNQCWYWYYGSPAAVSTGGSVTITDCEFTGNLGNGPALQLGGETPTVEACLFSGEYQPLVVRSGTSIVRNCTFVLGNNPVRADAQSHLIVENTIIAHNRGCAVDCDAAGTATLTCCDLYANLGGNWVGCIAGQGGRNGNFTVCPGFCGLGGCDFYLCDESPCLPGNHPYGYDCGQIGAFGQGCICGATLTEPTSWGAIKAIFK